MRAHWLVAVVVGCNLGVIACEPSEPVNVNKKDSGADVPQNTTGTGGAGTGGAGTGGSGGNGSGGAGTGGSGGAGTGGSGGTVPDAGNMDAPADSPGGNDGGNPDAAADQAPGDDVPPAADATPDMGMLDDAGFPIGATIGSCAPLNWTVSASASATADQPPNAIDGVLTTRWSTGAPQAAGMYYQIDFGGYVRLSQIKLDNTGSPGDHPRGYEVLASPDGVDFSTMVATGTPGDTAPVDNLVTIDFDPRAIRFLRIGMTGASGSWWSVHELGVTCQIPDGNGGFTTDVVPDDLRCVPGTDGGVPDGGAGDPFNRALWTLSASSTSVLPADIIGHATDGDITTRWSNGVLQVPGQFFKVDMGAVGCIGQIRMVASALDFVAAYKVSVSVDDVKYIAVAKGVGANVLQIRVPPHLARYVRIDQTGTANAWWSIDELTITP